MCSVCSDYNAEQPLRVGSQNTVQMEHARSSLIISGKAIFTSAPLREYFTTVILLQCDKYDKQFLQCGD